ncbi:DUF6082 family protein [Actinomadura sp. K4S16]|uniref:DUF6082 family protein n=1 Tax=Actinomadura sp. K4S16 TaxID=1316147 RepID=UPI0011ECC7B4|nr:DUF6082 family protein [Actinomadura sp. K4S16]
MNGKWPRCPLRRSDLSFVDAVRSPGPEQGENVLLAALALIGIAATLIFQAHDTKIAREEARRIAIAELLKMAMDDPALDEAWGPVPADADRKARRQLMYVNMIISEWQMSFETKALPETRLRAISHEMFSGRPGRAFWEEARQVRLNTAGSKRARRPVLGEGRFRMNFGT